MSVSAPRPIEAVKFLPTEFARCKLRGCSDEGASITIGSFHCTDSKRAQNIFFLFEEPTPLCRTSRDVATMGLGVKTHSPKRCACRETCESRTRRGANISRMRQSPRSDPREIYEVTSHNVTFPDVTFNELKIRPIIMQIERSEFPRINSEFSIFRHQNRLSG